MTLLHPMAAMVLYIALIGVFNFIVRKRAIQDRSLRLGFFNTFDSATYQPPEYVVRVGRHFDNQFQAPMVFLVTCLTGLMYNMNGPLLLGEAWLFILTRMVHSYFHLGSNHIIKRAVAFNAGWVCIIALWALILFAQG